MFLSGFAGHDGIRSDSSGWYAADGSAYPLAAGAPHLIEHLTLTGETYFDGPELIWTDTVQSLPNGTTADGYTTRRWQFFPQFKNIHMDVYRKILDGTLHLLNRQQVIDRTKLVVVDDTTSGNDQSLYSSPETLFSGVYLMDDDGTYLNQHSWYKKTGRYPTIPTVWQLTDDLAKSFPVQVKRSEYATRWPSIAAKTQELNALFPQESTGNLYVARQDNTWVTYNPYKTASGAFNLKYNNYTALTMTYGPYTTGVVKGVRRRAVDLPDQFRFRNRPAQERHHHHQRREHDADVHLRRSRRAPGQYRDRHPQRRWPDLERRPQRAAGHHRPVFRLGHRACARRSGRGTAGTGRAARLYRRAAIRGGALRFPAHWQPCRQWRLRCGAQLPGAGLCRRWRQPRRAPQDHHQHAAGGEPPTLATRYSAVGASVGTVDLYVNGMRVGTPAFAQTSSASEWASSPLTATLNAGDNVVEYRASAGAQVKLYLDNLAVAQ